MDMYSDYSASPAFIVGGGISSSMLDTITFQTYYNKYIPSIIEEVLGLSDANAAITEKKPHIDAEPVGAFLTVVLKSSNSSSYRYHDLFRSMSMRRLVPLGLHRIIRSRERGAALEGVPLLLHQSAPSN